MVPKQSCAALTTRCDMVCNERKFAAPAGRGGRGQPRSGKLQLQGRYRRRRGMVDGTVWHLRHSYHTLSVHVHLCPACHTTGAPPRVCQVAASVRGARWRSQRKPPNFRGHGGNAGAKPGLRCGARPHRLHAQPPTVAPPRPRPGRGGMARDEEAPKRKNLTSTSISKLEARDTVRYDIHM
jgi:hypothetical protein